MEQSSAVEKALDVLFYVHHAAEPLGVTALGRALGMPKSSVHRLLGALGRRGLVERDARGCYRPGIGLVALGVGRLAREPVVEAARPVLEREAESLGETLFLAAIRAGRIYVLDKCEGPGFLRAAPQVGSEVPPGATAVGKLHLAFAPELFAEVDADDAGMTHFTDHTLGARALAREVETVRERGWASNRDEWQVGLTAVAAPVFLGERLVAALAAAAPSARLPEADLAFVATKVCAAAAHVSARLAGAAS